tara:strand:+ start:300 stop:557 length:258 start_codon:yes stop_codon:yes gene_type:complete
MSEHPNKIDSDDYVYPAIVVPYREGGPLIITDPSGTKHTIGLRMCATEWRVVRPDDNPDTPNEVLAKGFVTEEEAGKKCAEINGE